MANQTLKVHPLADLLPRMTASSKEYKELMEDIKINGMKIPLLVTKDRKTLIDGRHRLYIAHDLGMTLKPSNFEVFKGKEEQIPAEIISRNIMRRHIGTADQRAALVLQIRGEQLEKEARERQKDKSGSFKGNGDVKGSVAAHVAKEAKVSTYKAEQAIKAKKAGLLEDVAKGKTSLRKASKTAPSKRRPRKEKPFDEVVWEKWQAFLKRFPPSRVAEVEKLVKGFIESRKK